MSHDRGCFCGKESYEYADCDKKDCWKAKAGLVEKKEERPSDQAYWSIGNVLEHRPMDDDERHYWNSCR